MDVPEGQIMISINEYNMLINSQEKLRALEGAGVDNWEGYDFAMESLENKD